MRWPTSATTARLACVWKINLLRCLASLFLMPCGSAGSTHCSKTQAWVFAFFSDWADPASGSSCWEKVRMYRARPCRSVPHRNPCRKNLCRSLSRRNPCRSVPALGIHCDALRAPWGALGGPGGPCRAEPCRRPRRPTSCHAELCRRPHRVVPLHAVPPGAVPLRAVPCTCLKRWQRGETIWHDR